MAGGGTRALGHGGRPAGLRLLLAGAGEAQGGHARRPPAGAAAGPSRRAVRPGSAAAAGRLVQCRRPQPRRPAAGRGWTGGEGRWIGLGPTANWDRKVWPAERFVAFFEALVAPGQPLEGARAVILGGPGPQEAAMAAPVLAALGDRAVSLMGSVSLPEAAAVLARCALFVGNDSGLMHLSAAAGTPTLGLFGPSRVGEYALRPPHRDRHRPGLARPRQHGGADAGPGPGRGAGLAHPGPAGVSITALVVARDEAARLPACLASLAPADAILVVLDRSTDASAAIAAAHGARVLEGAWALEGERRNAGIAACTTDWVLEVDADERVPPELWAAIRAVTARSAHAFHRVRIDNYVGERLILHGWGGSFGTTLKPILFRRGAKRWRAQRVHPGLDWTGAQGATLEGSGSPASASATSWTATSPTCCAAWTAIPRPRPATCWPRATSARCRTTSAAACRAS
ncbi:glycosyltransferase family 9 protein [Paeniroseomonas aquatica]|uniref:glycosyltransferase family 9 protein n=1 Tax=Paeniroseomonas aquatica TaxID=373043 RepID=UPI00361D105A